LQDAVEKFVPHMHGNTLVGALVDFEAACADIVGEVESAAEEEAAAAAAAAAAAPPPAAEETAPAAEEMAPAPSPAAAAAAESPAQGEAATKEELSDHAKVYLKWARSNLALRIHHLQYDMPVDGARAFVLRHSPGWVHESPYVPREVKEEFMAYSRMCPVLFLELRAVELLCIYVPGFYEVRRYYEVDLYLTVRPWWDWERGISKTLIHHLHLIAALFAFYKRPTLAKVALGTLDNVLYLADTEKGRPDIYVTVCLNCQLMNEKLQEIANGYQGLFVSWHRILEKEHFTNAAMNCAARVAAIREEKEELRRGKGSAAAAGTHRPSHIEVEHRNALRGPKWDETRALTLTRILKTFEKARTGGFAFLAGKLPDKIAVGRARLRTVYLPMMEAWLGAQCCGDQYDPLYKLTDTAPAWFLSSLCEKVGEKLKVDLAADPIPSFKLQKGKSEKVHWLRRVGYKGHGWQDFEGIE